jgi:hypothetical protein
LSFLDDLHAAEQIADRVAAQYGPAALAASDEAARERVWDSLRFYLTARAAPRKPFALDHAAAERVIGTTRELLYES